LLNNNSHSMETNTLFVADVPYTLQEGDFQALFQSCDGFVAARLRQDRNENVVGFVDFSDHVSAARAKDRFQGYKFNLQSEQGITIHFSHNTTTGRGHRYKRNREPEEDLPPYYSSLPQPNYAAYQPSYFMQQPFQNNIYPPIPPDASSTLYIEGLPLDATEREVSHIFRPFPGYQSLRVLSKESKQNPLRTYNLCFVEFDNKVQSTVAMFALQGYRMDKNDNKGLNITYAKTERKDGRLYSQRQSHNHHHHQHQHQHQQNPTTTNNINASNNNNNSGSPNSNGELNGNNSSHK